ncbi:hypothetical protein ACHAXA_006812 [Cyclostephanos tholiformis]|uniref:Uncharacterized protein n=1 Tax=Cyclostephanos tholiformis TaxID=382380 RepID=A0ABD3RUW5_9STRA
MTFAYRITPLNIDDAEYLWFLLRTIESQNWERFWTAIHSDPNAFQLIALKVSISAELNGMTILHACARFNPPVQIAKVIIDLFPESTRLVDCLNRTALHIAVGMRANLSTIQLLVDAYPMACAVLDTDGKIPLHLACDSACELFKGDEGCERDPPSYDVVSLLVRAWPSVVDREDNFGTSALEYAILSEAPFKVIRFLQTVTAEKKKKLR